MSYIYELEPKHYAALLATGELDIVDKDAESSVGEGKIPADNRNRTILIGLGGTGVQTLNHVKRVITNKLNPQWKNYIAFLAIDTDDNEFKNATHLSPDEFIKVTEPGIQDSVNKGLAAYPKAWRSFVDVEQARTLPSFNSMGASRKRLMGKMKLYYKRTGSKGVDEKIVAKLVDRKNNVLAPFTSKDNGHYEVYVIGSISGGTCSGSFLEMPSLVRKALASSDAEHERVQIYAMLYLPDTLTSLDPDNEEALMANGYASLKELDYFEGLKMREGTEESFPYNENATTELKVRSEHGFFTMPYLIGTRSGPTSNSKREACETIAEFFVSILGTMTTAGDDAFVVESFLSNALPNIGTRFFEDGNGEREAFGTDHSRPKQYGAVGFAQAAAPEQIVKAYTIAHACKVAGLEPITAADRQTRKANGQKLLPFYGEDQYFSASEVTRRSQELLTPLIDFMSSYQYTSFEYRRLFGENPTWEEIRNDAADSTNQDMLVNQEVTRLTNSEAIKQQKEHVNEQFKLFKNAVKAYVLENGPFAFVNLYEGRGIKEENSDERAIGIKELLNAMRDDLDLESRIAHTWPTEADALKEKQNKADKIKNAKGGLLGWATNIINDEKATQVSDWVNAYNAWVNARVNVNLRKEMLFTNGALNQEFIEPAGMLCQQLLAFGRMMQILSESYSAHGDALNKYDDFKKVNGGSAQVNIAALNSNVHAYLKSKAEQNAQTIDAQNVRNALIESFFNDPAKWMDIDENNIERKGGGSQVTLKSPKNPIGARYEFDRCLRENITMTTEVQIAELFTASGVNNEEFAGEIVDKLVRQSQPLFNGTLPENSTYQYIMYPQSLKAEVKNAIEAAAVRECGTGVGFYSTQYADSIMMHQLVAPFEMYNLAALKEWESQYEEMIRKSGNALHGRSPDLKSEYNERGTTVYSERTGWYDYPSVTFDADPKRRSKEGKRTHEGEVRVEMDKVIKEARKKGILFLDQVKDGYIVKCIHLDKSVEWKFDVNRLDEDEETGLLPEGKELLDTVIRKLNKVQLSDVTRTVRLAFGGLLEKAHTTPEYAWECASRVLYVHRSMFNDIRDTLDRTAEWFAEVDKYNEVLKRRLNPARMYRLIQAGILRQTKNKLWVYTDAEGDDYNVVNLSESRMEMLRDNKPGEAALVDTGLTLFYLFDKLMKVVSQEELYDAVERALALLDDEDYQENGFAEANKLAKTMLAEELEKINELGADLTNVNKPKRAFIDALSEHEIVGKNLGVEIPTFYKTIKLWKSVQ